MMFFGPNSRSSKKHKLRNMKHKKETPPILGEKVLKIFLPKGDSESVAGDYEELYAEVAQTQGKSKALVWYWIQIVKSIWAGITVYVWWSLTMFKNYLTIALRYLKRHKIYSFINISSLAIGMACCILILLWIDDEIRYDRFHEQTENLYRVVNDLNFGPHSQITEGTGYPLGPAMKEEIPEVREVVRLLPTIRLLVAYEEKKNIMKKISTLLILLFLRFSPFLLFKEIPIQPYLLPPRSLSRKTWLQNTSAAKIPWEKRSRRRIRMIM